MSRVKEVLKYALSIFDLDQKIKLFENFNNGTYDSTLYSEFINGIFENTNPPKIQRKQDLKKNTKEYPFTVKKSYHKKNKIDIWILQIKRGHWLPKDTFQELKEYIYDNYNAYYSGYSSGFIFESEPSKDILKNIAKALLEFSEFQE
jgi:hypothetical protein